jgi:hypothetical protein
MSDLDKPLYDAWGTKFDKTIHLVRKGVPAQDREGRWKFTAKAKKEFAKALNQQEIEALKNIRGKHQ